MKKMTPAKRIKSKEHKRRKMIEREKRMADLMSELRERAAPLTEDQAAHLKAIASE